MSKTLLPPFGADRFPRARHSLGSIAAMVCLLLSGLPATAQSPTSPQVRIESGVLEGVRDGDANVSVFRGVPYAAPPVGEWRWRPPQPAKPWAGVRPATTFASVCPQPSNSTSEDCLYLNVWTPRPERGARLPVIVYFHGGGGSLGSGAIEAEDLARMGVVVVAPNYRLGMLGYLGHPALRRAPQQVSGNHALLDQIAALQWVRRNIAQFGGDSSRVTAAGASSGARTVATLLVSPLAKGLFQRAFLQSGSGMDRSVESMAAGEAKGVQLAGIIGIAGGDASAASALRALEPSQLVSTVSRFRAQNDGPPAPSVSTSLIDGWAIPKPVDVLLAQGAFHLVPILIGTNADEGSPVVAREARFSSIAEYHEALRRWYGDRDGILALAYPVAEVTQILPTFERLYGDEMYGAPARAFARLVSAHGARVFFYYFTRVGEGARDPGAFHGSQDPFFLGRSIPPLLGRTPYDASLARTMSGYLVAFATTGDPNGGDRPRWPAFQPGSERYLELGAEVVEKQNLRKAEWDAQDRVARSRGAIRP